MARIFAVTSTPDSVEVKPGGTAQVSVTVTNSAGRPLLSRLRVVPLGETQAAWLQLSDADERHLDPGESHQVTVRVAPPRGAAAGAFSFRVDAVSVERPDDDFAEGPPIRLTVPAAEKGERRGVPWWIFLTAGLVLVVGVGVTLALVSSPKPKLGEPCRQNVCDKGLVCFDATDTCLGAVGFRGCSDPGDCVSGVCRDSVCAEPGSGVPDPPRPPGGLGEACETGICGPNLVCVGGRCLGDVGFRGCGSHAQCSSDACRAGVCMGLPYGPDTCVDGFVWRDAVPGDHVCVPPGTRAETAQENSLAGIRRNPAGGPYGPDTCMMGFVWRDAFPGDHVCVPGESRARAAQDNAHAAERRVRQ